MARACPVCGAMNDETDDFCGNCGSYLGWASGQHDEPAAAQPAVADAPRPSPSRPAMPGDGPGGAGDERARDPLGPVQPARPVAPRPVVRQAAVAVGFGDPCPACGTPNPPGRRFCRHCAAALTPAAAPAARRRRWWWPFRRRAGIWDSGRLLRRAVVVLVLAALVAAGVLLFPAARNAVEDVRDKLSSTAEITPSAATASAEVPGHRAALLTDGLTNTYWGAPAVGASVSFTFSTPIRLVDIIVHTGASTVPAEFQKQARASRIELVATGSGGGSRSWTETLDDRPGPQTFQLGISDVSSVRLVVVAAAGLMPGRHIAVGEVEFFKRS